MKDITWFTQRHNDSCCAVYAIANCALYPGNEVTAEMVEEARDIGKCRCGGTINTGGVVSYFEVPLIQTNDADLVFNNGGVLSIWHPIFNGHSCFVFPDDEALTLINSWLGPEVSRGVGRKEILQFVPDFIDRIGGHWYIKES